MTASNGQPTGPGADTAALQHLAEVATEIEAHTAVAGWDQPPRVYALVHTRDLLAREPGLAADLGLAGPADVPAHELVPVEQELVAAEESLEDWLLTITWPAEVAGAAAVMERLVLPPAAEAQLPADPDEADAFAQAHPDRQDVRIVAAVTRAGATYCVLRVRQEDEQVMGGPDLVPELLRLVGMTLEEETPE